MAAPSPSAAGAAQIGADGGFSAPVRVPSLLTGDPTWPEMGDLVGVMLITPANQPQPFLQTIADPPSFPAFNVKVVDAQTEQLIPPAKVSFEVWRLPGQRRLAGPGRQVRRCTGISNQVGQVLGTTELTDDEKAQIALMKAMCMPHRPSRSTPDKWELINPTLDQTLSEPAVQGLLLENSIIVEAAAAGATGAYAPAGDAAVAAGGCHPLPAHRGCAGRGLRPEGRGWHGEKSQPARQFPPGRSHLSRPEGQHPAQPVHGGAGQALQRRPVGPGADRRSSWPASARRSCLSPTALPRFARYHSVKERRRPGCR